MGLTALLMTVVAGAGIFAVAALLDGAPQEERRQKRRLAAAIVVVVATCFAEVCLLMALLIEALVP